MPTIICKNKKLVPLITKAWKEIADAIPGISEIADVNNLHIYLVASPEFSVLTGEDERGDVYGIYNRSLYGPPTIILRQIWGLAHEIGHWLDDAKHTIETLLDQPEEWLHTGISYRKLIGIALDICIENGMERDGYLDASKEMFARLFNTGVAWIVTEYSDESPLSCQTIHLFAHEYFDPELKDVVIFPASYYATYWGELHQHWLRATRRAIKSLQKDKDFLHDCRVAQPIVISKEKVGFLTL